jgi:SSS family transporter
MEETSALHQNFTVIDWLIVAGYLLLTTWVGHMMRGKQATIKDFFVAGRSLPWPAVCGSIIATEISALTFIGVPSIVFAAGGDWTYLQWAIGSIIARFIVGFFFVKAYYQEEIYSPYDYVGTVLGGGAKKLITFLFFAGSILGQSVRVMVTAFILDTVTPMNFVTCIVIIGIFAVAWTLMGGMHTVIWTDVMQFFLFLFGAVFALLYGVYSLDGNWQAFLDINTAGTAASAEKTLDWGKMTLLDLRTDPTLQFTLWVGIFAMPFQNMAAFGTDQLNAQRMFCCRGPREARLAIIFSSFSQVITLLMLGVGAGLVAYYAQNPPSEAVQAMWAADQDFVFPVWIVNVLPTGISGLILAGAFAAAISSLDSILAALSQTSLSLIIGREELADESKSTRMLFISRMSVIIWGVLLVLFTVALYFAKQAGSQDLVTLAFQMVAYTFGPMLGLFLLSLMGVQVRMKWLVTGAITCLLISAWKLPQIGHLLKAFGSVDLSEYLLSIQPAFAYPWMYPITTALMMLFGLLGHYREQAHREKTAGNLH